MSKKKFNFENYPELEPYHIEWNRLVEKTYRAESRYNKSNLEKDKDSWKEALKKWDEYEVEYSNAIFSILNNEKPKLFDLSTGKYEKWDNVINSKERIGWCVTIVEQSGGRWRLSPEYYQ